MNTEFFYPKTPADQKIATKMQAFNLWWFADPIYKGDYPQEMKDVIGDRLPTFTEEQKKLIQGSSDFLGINYYTSHLVEAGSQDPKAEKNYFVDVNVTSTADPTWDVNDLDWPIVP